MAEMKEKSVEELRAERTEINKQIREKTNQFTFPSIYRNLRQKEVLIMRDKSMKGAEKKKALVELLNDTVAFIKSEKAQKTDKKDSKKE